MTKEGQLQVWWIPQVPLDGAKLFTVNVESVREGALLMHTLAKYDNYQYENNIKPDYCNAGGLRVFEEGEWVDWQDEETGEDDPVCFIGKNLFPITT